MIPITNVSSTFSIGLDGCVDRLFCLDASLDIHIDRLRVFPTCRRSQIISVSSFKVGQYLSEGPLHLRLHLQGL